MCLTSETCCPISKGFVKDTHFFIASTIFTQSSSYSTHETIHIYVELFIPAIRINSIALCFVSNWKRNTFSVHVGVTQSKTFAWKKYQASGFRTVFAYYEIFLRFLLSIRRSTQDNARTHIHMPHKPKFHSSLPCKTNTQTQFGCTFPTSSCHSIYQYIIHTMKYILCSTNIWNFFRLCCHHDVGKNGFCAHLLHFTAILIISILLNNDGAKLSLTFTLAAVVDSVEIYDRISM